MAQREASIGFVADHDSAGIHPAPARACSLCRTCPTELAAVLWEWKQPLEGARVTDRLTGSPDLAIRVLRTFAREAVADVEAIRKAYREEDAAQLARSAHRLKGAAAMVGAEPLRKRAALIESFARTGDMAQAGACLEDLDAELRCCCHYSDEVLSAFRKGESRQC